MSVSTPSVAEICDTAAELIVEKGWWDGRKMSNGCFCLVTSVVTATSKLMPSIPTHTERTDAIEVESLAFNAIKRQVWPDIEPVERVGMSLADWNDNHTEADVVRVLREAAAS
jgi:hypothetical protein